MKVLTQILFLISLLYLVGFEYAPITKEGITKKTEYLYVSAESGLNYRETPKGVVIGTIPLNFKVDIVERTGIFDEVLDGENILKGEWVGIKKENEVVYVFDVFLSRYRTHSELKMYYSSSSNKTDNGNLIKSFINITEGFNSDFEAIPNDLNLKEQTNKEAIVLNKKQREAVFKEMGVLESDFIFIYNVLLDRVYTLSVSALPLIAQIDIYGLGYEIGFNIEGNDFGYYNYVFIGEKNPFETGERKFIVWEKINKEEFPIVFDKRVVDKDIRSWFDNIVVGESYKFSNKKLDYYIQNLQTKEEQEVVLQYLVIIDSNVNELVYNDVFVSSESTHLIPLNLKDNQYEYPEDNLQWTGQILKGKPAIIDGFVGHSFGCESILFAHQVEPPIRILCDARH